MPTSTMKKLPATMLEKIRWNGDGLITAIAQDEETGEVLMLAWMNETALSETLRTGQAHYWSRSRQKLWHKGEESGQFQVIQQLLFDCDGDAVLLKVKQEGVACHTGRRSCFFYEWVNEKGHSVWRINAPIIKDPKDLYAQAK